jgi:hypothetical protein
MALIPVAARALRQESEALIRLLDATPIPPKDRLHAQTLAGVYPVS